jgi:uncharacterized protein YndB with AHSA1/START domain
MSTSASGTAVRHATFTIERVYEAAPERVFAAWADPAAKREWFRGPQEWEPGEYELDFRVGGREISRGGPAGGPWHAYDARYYDILAGERIVYAYDMHIDDVRISVSVATVELFAEGGATRLRFTEQGAYLDPRFSEVDREGGTRGLLEQLGMAVAGLPVTTVPWGGSGEEERRAR